MIYGKIRSVERAPGGELKSLMAEICICVFLCVCVAGGVFPSEYDLVREQPVTVCFYPTLAASPGR